MYVNFVLQTYSPFRNDVHLYFSMYKLFNYKYVHIEIPMFFI